VGYFVCHCSGHAHSFVGDIRTAILESGAMSQLTTMLTKEDIQQQEIVIASLAKLSQYGMLL
jgi:hypothetical protein